MSTYGIRPHLYPATAEEAAQLRAAAEQVPLIDAERWAKDQAIGAAGGLCGEPNPLRHVNPDWDVTCHLPAGHSGLHKTSMADEDGTETVSWVWDETRKLLGPA